MLTYKTYNNIAKQGIEYLNKNGFKEDINDPDALLIRSQILNDNDFNKSLRCICRAGAGVNHIPLDMATDRGIVVFNTPGGNANATAELTFALMMSLLRKIPFANESTHKGKWEKKNIKGNELSKKTLGIVGFSNVGVRLSNLVKGFNMNILMNSK